MFFTISIYIVCLNLFYFLNYRSSFFKIITDDFNVIPINDLHNFIFKCKFLHKLFIFNIKLKNINKFIIKNNVSSHNSLI